MENLLAVVFIITFGVIAVVAFWRMIDNYIEDKNFMDSLAKMSEKKEYDQETCGICSGKFEYLGNHLIIKNGGLGTIYGIKVYDSGIIKVGRVCKHCIKDDKKLQKISDFTYFYDESKE